MADSDKLPEIAGIFDIDNNCCNNDKILSEDCCDICTCKTNNNQYYAENSVSTVNRFVHAVTGSGN
jgi:hypothetical protein